MLKMRHWTAATLIALLALFGIVGCNDTVESSTKQETTISTPSGTTTITVEKEVTKTGEEPPAAIP